MSSSCLSSGGGGGGGRAYLLEAMDVEIIKSPSSTSWISSPSSESSNCRGAISTRKARTPRKRPNQTYNEAAALLSTAYPKIFPTTKFDNCSNNNTFFLEPSELLMPFHQVDTSRLLLHLHLHKPLQIKGDNPCRSPPEISNSSDFDADSILDEEIGGGIESIMGNLEEEKEASDSQTNNTSFCYGYPVGLGLGLGLRAMKSGDDEYWKFPCVNVADVNPNVVTKKKKKVEEESAEQSEGLLLNLNYDGVLHAWSDKPSPFSAADYPPSEVRARLAQIDLFSDNGGVREASVQRYKEKRRTRLFSKKIRYQVRKLNADRRPRMKGRFVRTPTSSDD